MNNFRYFFLAFSYLGVSLKSVLSCRRELNIQGPGATEIEKKHIKTTLDCGVVVGSHFLRKIYDFCEKSRSPGPGSATTGSALKNWYV